MQLSRFGILVTIILLCTASFVQAQEQLYVTDQLKITVRSGPSLGNRVIATLASGDQVTLLERKDNTWGKVKTADGKEGWVQHRYLVEEKPALVVLRETRPGQDARQQQMDQLREANQAMKTELEELRAKADAVQTQYDRLKRDSGQALQLRTELEQVKASRARQVRELETTVTEQAARLKKLETENESMRFTGGLMWFLAGAGVLIVGWVTGWLLGRRRKRYSSLY